MKKYIFTMAAFILGVAQMNAQSFVFDEVVEVPQGGKAPLTIKYTTGGKTITTYTFNFVLPEGLSMTKGKTGMEWVMDSKNDAFTTMPQGTSGMAALSPDVASIFLDGTEGTLGTAYIEASADLAIDTELDVTVNTLQLVEYNSTENTYTSNNFDPITFKVKIVENIVTLDENSTTPPEAAENVDVKVLRNIKGGNWSTICLPFSMTDEQIVTAFGEGAEWADISNHDIVEDGDDIASITINFETATTFEANHPYIIKVNNDIESFKLQGITIEPEEDPCYEMDNGKTGSRRVVYRGMYGTYVAETYVPEFALFISKNLFWYAKANTTKMKAFRAWLDLGGDVVTAVENGSAKFNFVVDGEATSIDGFGPQRIVEGVYDLSGRKIKLEDGDLNKLQKGVYIIDGKKVTIK